MNSKFLLPLLLTSVTAQADLTPDATAFQACLNRFETVNRSEGLMARRADVYRSPTSENGTYHYYFNASGPRAEAEQRHYRVECQARRIGKVTEFAINPGRWVYQAPGDTRIATR